MKKSLQCWQNMNSHGERQKNLGAMENCNFSVKILNFYKLPSKKVSIVHNRQVLLLAKLFICWPICEEVLTLHSKEWQKQKSTCYFPVISI